MKRLKQRLYHLTRDDDENDISSNIFDGVVITLIIINIFLVILDTFDMPAWYSNISGIIEVVSVIFFAVEYLVRLWTADLRYPDKRPAVARIKYVFSFVAIIDLLAILPFYLPFVFSIDLRILRVFRVLRLFRLFKVSRYLAAFSTIASVFRKKAHQLLSSVFVVLLLMVLASVLMYSVEHEAQPDAFSNAFSGLWWAVTTLTTVGYGDISPITIAGKIIGGVFALLGVGLVAVPTGIISAGFIETVEHKKAKEEDEKTYCPYCGHKLDK